VAKGKGKSPSTCYRLALLTEDSWTAALYNLGSGSWFAWTNKI